MNDPKTILACCSFSDLGVLRLVDVDLVLVIVNCKLPKVWSLDATEADTCRVAYKTNHAILAKS